MRNSTSAHRLVRVGSMFTWDEADKPLQMVDWSLADSRNQSATHKNTFTNTCQEDRRSPCQSGDINVLFPWLHGHVHVLVSQQLISGGLYSLWRMDVVSALKGRWISFKQFLLSKRRHQTVTWLVFLMDFCGGGLMLLISLQTSTNYRNYTTNQWATILWMPAK